MKFDRKAGTRRDANTRNEQLRQPCLTVDGQDLAIPALGGLQFGMWGLGSGDLVSRP